MTTWHKFVAVGDSFTEGLEDRRPYGRHRGWADRVAELLAERTDNFTYANLAVRGRKLDDIVGNQLPLALEMEPDLISLAGGVNDLLRPKWDASRSADLLEEGVIKARDSGADVLVFAFGNLERRSRALGTVTPRLAEYREITLALAEEHDCFVVDFWPETVFDDSRFWAEDRLHLNELGHERVGNIVATSLELGEYDWREPLPAAHPRGLVQTIRDDIEWTGRYLAPWLTRRIRRQSSGDEVQAKRPVLSPLK